MIGWAVMALTAASASGQLGPAPRSPEAQLDRLFEIADRNRDDEIDAEELERIPPAIRDAMERAGLRTSRRISKKLFFRMAPRVVDQLRRPADAPPFAVEADRSERLSPGGLSAGDAPRRLSTSTPSAQPIRSISRR
ncbi:MAG TPA: hypothetical protein EYP14_18455 [Planctomycetaceae bacterium]|nr:hypothetical protein [Planctomycetaceae bacterium]